MVGNFMINKKQFNAFNLLFKNNYFSLQNTKSQPLSPFHHTYCFVENFFIEREECTQLKRKNLFIFS